MTAQLFLMLFVIFASVSVILTEALKKATKETLANNILALIVALVVGGGGSVVAYIFMGIAFTTSSIIAIVLMVIAVWMGAMVGYDKIKQLIEQILGKKK